MYMCSHRRDSYLEKNSMVVSNLVISVAIFQLQLVCLGRIRLCALILDFDEK